MAPGIAASALAIKSFVLSSKTACRRASTRISPPASSSTIPRSGAARLALLSTKTARYWSPKMLVARSGVSAIRARPRKLTKRGTEREHLIARRRRREGQRRSDSYEPIRSRALRARNCRGETRAIRNGRDRYPGAPRRAAVWAFSFAGHRRAGHHLDS